MSKYNCVIVLGPTAVGKTSIGVALAHHFDGEIISADSRQTYRHLDIGSGKDLNEYILDGKPVPYHLIDIIDLPSEYTVYDYQKDFYKAFNEIQNRGKLPFVVGGTGMYLDSIVRNYELVNLPENKKLREELEATPLEVLAQRLLKEQPDLHVKADLQEKERVPHCRVPQYFRRTGPRRRYIRVMHSGQKSLWKLLKLKNRAMIQLLLIDQKLHLLL